MAGTYPGPKRTATHRQSASREWTLFCRKHYGISLKHSRIYPHALRGYLIQELSAGRGVSFQTLGKFKVKRFETTLRGERVMVVKIVWYPSISVKRAIKPAIKKLAQQQEQQNESQNPITP